MSCIGVKTAVTLQSANVTPWVPIDWRGGATPVDVFMDVFVDVLSSGGGEMLKLGGRAACFSMRSTEIAALPAALKSVGLLVSSCK